MQSKRDEDEKMSLAPSPKLERVWRGLDDSRSRFLGGFAALLETIYTEKRRDRDPSVVRAKLDFYYVRSICETVGTKNRKEIGKSIL